MPGDQGSGTDRNGTVCNNNAQPVDSVSCDNKQQMSDHEISGIHTSKLQPETVHTPVSDGSTINSDEEWEAPSGKPPIYGALDLGTNNCRLLLAEPNSEGFQIVDAFSRIIRLGEGVGQTNKLSEQAMRRTIDALKICAEKMRYHKVSRSRLIATEACRAAKNNDYFLKKVKQETGLNLEIISEETEAKLAVFGCVPLIDETCDHVLVFDIGGGSSELIWLDINKIRESKNKNQFGAKEAIIAWTSLPVGVVTLADKFGGEDVDSEKYQHMVNYLKDMLDDFSGNIAQTTNINNSNIHFLGTSGTVTTMAGIHLCLDHYDRQKVDGIWMHVDDITRVSQHLLNLDIASRAAEPCIGHERADLVLGGCAILEAMLDIWPTSRLRVADRGLREGILAELMSQDGYIRPGQYWTSQPKNHKQRKTHSSLKGQDHAK